ncbi:ribonuclease P [Candidatus Bathyarchaeota archaeon]|nr:ribonuclease P [Candidatus Bathyarchaeota archaeon]
MNYQKGLEKQIALNRIQILFRLAIQVFHRNRILAQRYVELARRISMRCKVRIPPEYKRLVCRHCKQFILPGIGCRVRIQLKREPHVVITCLYCGGRTRIPLRRKNHDN